MTMQIPYDDAANKLFSYANTWYKWGGQDKNGIDCSGYVSEWWEDIGYKPEGFDTTADKAFDNFRTGAWAGTKLTKPQFGCVAFYGSGTNAGHIVIGLSSQYIIGANGGSAATNTVSEAKARYAFVKVQALNYRDDLLGIWMPDYEFVSSPVIIPTETLDKYKVTNAVNLRTSPTASSASLGVMPTGVTINEVSKSTVEADGHTWRNVSWNAKVGWAASDYITKV